MPPNCQQICQCRACYFGCVRGRSKSVQVLFNGTEAVTVLIFDNVDIASPAVLPSNASRNFIPLGPAQDGTQKLRSKAP